MLKQFVQLRQRQLEKELAHFEEARGVVRPIKGWLCAVREALGLSQTAVARRLKVSPTQVRSFELSEAKDRITLNSLRRVAQAMDCEVVYAVIPKKGTLTELAEQRARAQVTEAVLDVEHNMALENQAPGDVNELIKEETNRRLKQ